MTGLTRQWKVWSNGTVARTTVCRWGGALLAAAGIVMWVSRPGPRTGGAREMPPQTQADRRLEVVPSAELPVIPGRHDRIHHDFFRFEPAGGDQGATPSIPEPKPEGGRVQETTVPENGKEGPKLKAIMMGTRPKALIDDMIVSVGEKVKLIASASNDDEFEVTAIDDQKVQLQRGGQVVILRLEPEADGPAGGAWSPSER